MKHIAEVAEKHGVESVHLSVRQSMELTHVNYKDFDGLVQDLEAAGRRSLPAAPGSACRPPAAAAPTIPTASWIPRPPPSRWTQKLFGKATGHHKLKVSFSGCPIDCFKSYLNDVGFQGVVYPALDNGGLHQLRTVRQELRCRGHRDGERRKAGFQSGKLPLLRRLHQGLPHRGLERAEERIPGTDRRQGGTQPGTGDHVRLFLPATRWWPSSTRC